MKHEFTMKWAAIGLFSIAATWAKIPNQVQILLILMGLDLVTGLLVAATQKAVESHAFFKGLVKKSCGLILLGALHLIEEPLHLQFDLDQIVAYGFIAYEVMSIIENAARAGVPIPSVIVDVLAKAKIKTATQEEISRSFSMEEHTEVERTPAGQPDVSVTTTAVTQVVSTPIKPPDPSPGP